MDELYDDLAIEFDSLLVQRILKARELRSIGLVTVKTEFKMCCKYRAD
jgi:hypothetical protein